MIIRPPADFLATCQPALVRRQDAGQTLSDRTPACCGLHPGPSPCTMAPAAPSLAPLPNHNGPEGWDGRQAQVALLPTPGLSTRPRRPDPGQSSRTRAWRRTFFLKAAARRRLASPGSLPSLQRHPLPPAPGPRPPLRRPESETRKALGPPPDIICPVPPPFPISHDTSSRHEKGVPRLWQAQKFYK